MTVRLETDDALSVVACIRHLPCKSKSCMTSSRGVSSMTQKGPAGHGSPQRKRPSALSGKTRVAAGPQLVQGMVRTRRRSERTAERRAAILTIIRYLCAELGLNGL